MIVTIPVGELEANCYVVWKEGSKEAFVIDPGAEPDAIEGVIKEEGLKVKYIVNTHGHFDHVGAGGAIKSSLGGVIAVHRDDAELLADAHEHGIIFGVKAPKQPSPDLLLNGDELLEAEGLSFRVIHTPGHTKGGICLYSRKEGLLFTGDTLFAGSVGRTDFPGGSYEDLMDSIKRNILPLGDSVKVYPGHGPETTIREEKASNPFLTGLRV